MALLKTQFFKRLSLMRCFIETDWQGSIDSLNDLATWSGSDQKIIALPDIVY